MVENIAIHVSGVFTLIDDGAMSQSRMLANGSEIIAMFEVFVRILRFLHVQSILYIRLYFLLWQTAGKNLRMLILPTRLFM